MGSHLSAYLKKCKDTVVLEDGDAGLPSGLGHVIYCIGVTTDFASRLEATMTAHVTKALEIISRGDFESFTYLSSTRVYENGDDGDEQAVLNGNPAQVADFYKISKIAGEAVCLTHPRSTVRVVRLSNVLGYETPALTFVPSLITTALREGRIVIRTAPESVKDYVAMPDVVRMLPEIALHGRHRLYNLASGRQTKHDEIVRSISAATGCTFGYAEGSPQVSFPPVSISRLREEFDFQPVPTAEIIPELCARYAKN